MIRSKLSSPEFRENFDLIDWSQGKPAPADGRYGSLENNEPVRTIRAIREDKPHVSNSVAIHADQVASFNKDCARGVHYNEIGQLVSTSDHARRRELKRRGLADGWM